MAPAYTIMCVSGTWTAFVSSETRVERFQILTMAVLLFHLPIPVVLYPGVAGPSKWVVTVTGSWLKSAIPVNPGDRFIQSKRLSVEPK